MEILDMKVDWREAWDNKPEILLLVNRIPLLESMRFEKKDSLYYAENRGYVAFFSYSSPGRGYGGYCFRITMQDGSSEVLVGPWSSRASVMNEAGFTPCLDVLMTSDPDSWKSGFGFTSAHVTLELCSPISSWLPGVELVCSDNTFIPILSDGRRKPCPKTYWGKKDNYLPY